MRQMRFLPAFIYTAIFIIYSLFFISPFSQAQVNQLEAVKSATKEGESQGPTDPKELEAFLDEFFAEAMDKEHIPGLVFILVKDGEIFFSKGYGYSDLEKKKPVIPDKTLFRVASVSKLFTATAVMQLYERGLLNLDDDVNKHLKLFKIEENFPQPVTVANLLTHTGGFRGSMIGGFTKRKSDQIPLDQYLAAKMPPRDLPPGSIIIYSNQGYNLLGYLVEEISGIPFAQYIDENILKPLGMNNSSFLLPSHLAPNLAKSYMFKNGSYQVAQGDYPLYTPSPCGSLIATGADMARFMIAHLQGGRCGNNRILNEETVQEMHQQHFTNYHQLPGTCYGFYEYYRNNQRAIFHDGDLSGFCSRLFLMPDRNLGLFVVYNSSRSRFRMDLTTTFINHYYPIQDKAVPPQPSIEFKNRAKRFIGSYRNMAWRLHSFDKLQSMSGLINIAASEEGLISTWLNTQSRWVEVEPLLFQFATSEAKMAFREDSQGNITHLFLDLQQMPIAFEKLAWHETPTFLWIASGFIGFVFLSACSIWPIMHRIRRRRKKSAESSRSDRRARLLAILTVALNLIFLIGFTASMFLLIDELDYGVPFVMIALLVIPIVTAVLTIGLLIFTILAWKDQSWSLAGRLYYSLITLTCIGFILFLNYWNLLGFSY